MNLPNKLTMLRIILIPVFLVLVLVDSIPLHYLWALIVFLAGFLLERHPSVQADGPPCR